MKEKKELGLKYKILTSETAFFGKIKSSTKSTEESETVQCSVMSAQDFNRRTQQSYQSNYDRISSSMAMCYDARDECLEDLKLQSEKLESRHFSKREKGSSGPGLASKIASAFTGLFAKK